MGDKRYFMGDFETTVYKGQTMTEVWASAVVEFGTEDVKIFHSIDETFQYLCSLDGEQIVIFYHNLKFDGGFWISYLLLDQHFTQALNGSEEDLETLRFRQQSQMKPKTFRYTISDAGQWYKIQIKIRGKLIEIRDSLKLLPFSVREIGRSFGTKHHKLEMEYKGFRYAGCKITDEEKEYIANDVLVVKEALEIMFEEGHNKITIGSCCLSEYRETIGPKYFRIFPNLYNLPIDETVYGTDNAGAYIRKSYRGGWCYLAKGKSCKDFYNGVTADVNSLYPSMMHSESGSRYPVGFPTFWVGDIPEEAKQNNRYYFVRVNTRFYLKSGYLPFVQNKTSWMYSATECLETSDIWDSETNMYWDHFVGFDGEVHSASMTMTLTMTDWQLLQDHYNLVDCVILDGCWFETETGIFDEYINYWREIKKNSKGARRQIAKLMLNSLYGKMASSKDSSFKVAYEKEDHSIGFYSVIANEKKPGYIPVGSAITSYARNFTIRAAQANYYGPDQPGFIYADTDSIHCDLSPEEIKGIKVDDTEFCCWKLEASWDHGWFVRQKTYLEHVVAENLKPIENPYYNVKCAGMPDRCKELFLSSVTGKEIQANSPEEKKFLKKKRTIHDFNIGLRVPGKLIQRRIMGGVVLQDSYYEMR
jgi:hypothetical protein